MPAKKTKKEMADNLRLHLEYHPCEIGEFSMILPGAVVRGSAKVRTADWIRANQFVE